MTFHSPRNVIIVRREPAPFAAHYERPPIGPGYRSVATPDSVRACLYVSLPRGIVREPEGIETPPPGTSSERPRSKHREPDIRNVEAEGSSPFTSTKGPGHRAEVDPPKDQDSLTCLYVSLRGSEESADERYLSRF
jgi:hypothetical protein